MSKGRTLATPVLVLQSAMLVLLALVLLLVQLLLLIVLLVLYHAGVYADNTITIYISHCNVHCACTNTRSLLVHYTSALNSYICNITNITCVTGLVAIMFVLLLVLLVGQQQSKWAWQLLQWQHK